MADSDQPADGSGQATDTLLPRLDLVCEAKPQGPSLSRPTAELVFLPGSGSISAVRAGCRPASLRCQRLRAGSAWPSAGQWLSPSSRPEPAGGGAGLGSTTAPLSRLSFLASHGPARALPLLLSPPSQLEACCL